MENFVGTFEDRIYGPNLDDPVQGWQSVLEPTSFFDFFILQELGRTVDGYRSSSFMHKHRNDGAWNGRMVAGPMWDFNLSYGNADYCDANTTTGWQYNFDQVCNFTTAIPFWWKRLLDSQAYRNGLRCRWETLRQGPLHTDSVNYFIDSVATMLTAARVRNFQKWPIIGVYVNWNGFVGNTYQEDVNFLKTYIQQRSQWLDANIPGNCDAAVSEYEFVPEYHKIWPNPATDQAYLGFTLFSPGNVTIEFRDLQGRLVYTKNMGELAQGEHAQALELAHLSSGTYVYALTNSGQHMGSGKFIVR
jgi:hypothetical protein